MKNQKSNSESINIAQENWREYTEPNIDYDPFDIPEINATNQILRGHFPMHDDQLVYNRLYIPKLENTNLRKLFKQFHLHPDKWPDLTWIYLILCTASQSRFDTKFFINSIIKEEINAIQFLDLIKDIQKGNRMLKEFSLTTKKIVGKNNSGPKPLSYGPQETNHFESSDAIKLLTEILFKYQDTEEYKSIQPIYISHKQAGTPAFKTGHSNPRLRHEKYYLNLIYNYLCHQEYSQLVQTDSEKKKSNPNLKSKEGKIRFIIKLMVLSKMSGPIESSKELENRIDNFEKKLPTNSRKKKN